MNTLTKKIAKITLVGLLATLLTACPNNGKRGVGNTTSGGVAGITDSGGVVGTADSNGVGIGFSHDINANGNANVNDDARGAGDWGGGNVLLVDVSPEDIVEMIPKVRSVMKYAAKNVQIILESSSEDTFSEPEFLEVARNLKKVWFSDPNHNIFKMIESANIEVRKDEDCRDAKGNSVDGSIHNVEHGDFCLSAKSLAPKLRRNNAFGSLMGMIFHEMTHRLVQDKESFKEEFPDIEQEAKLSESYVNDIKESVADLNWLGSNIRQLLESESLLQDSIAQIVNAQQELKRLSEDSGTRHDGSAIGPMCYSIGKTLQRVMSAMNAIFSNITESGVTAFSVEDYGKQFALSLQMQLLDLFCQYPESNLRMVDQDTPITLEQYLTSENNRIQQPPHMLNLVQKEDYWIKEIRPNSVDDVAVAMALALMKVRKLLDSTGRTLDTRFNPNSIENVTVTFNLLADLELPFITSHDSNNNFIEFSHGQRVERAESVGERCSLRHSQYFPTALVGASSRGSDLIAKEASPFYISTEDDGYGLMFLTGNYRGRHLDIVIRCSLLEKDDETYLKVTPQLIEKHFKGIFERVDEAP